MSAAAVAAGIGAASAVLATWEVLRGAEAAAVRGGLGVVLAPWRLAGERGRRPTDPERRRLAALASLVLAAGGLLVATPVVAVLLAVAGPAASARLLAWRRARWVEAVADGAPAVARALADALTGGHSVRGAIAEAAAAGGAGPAADAELRAVAAALALGAPTDEALEALRARVGVPAYDTLVAAILLQREAGGDLAALLRALAADLDEARRAVADARTATAQARLTAKLVLGLPAAAAVLVEVARPGAVGALLSGTAPRILVATAIALDVVALVAVGRIARVVP